MDSSGNKNGNNIALAEKVCSPRQKELSTTPIISFTLDNKSTSASHILTPVQWIVEFPPEWSTTWSDTASETCQGAPRKEIMLYTAQINSVWKGYNPQEYGAVFECAKEPNYRSTVQRKTETNMWMLREWWGKGKYYK